MAGTEVDGKRRFWIGETEVDPEGLRLYSAGKETSLEPKVMLVLVELAANAGDVVSRAQLIDRIWNVSYGGDESLTRAISILRKHLEDNKSTRRVIETVPRRGYRLVADVTTENPTTDAVAAAEDVVSAPAQDSVVRQKRRVWKPLAAFAVLVVVAFFASVFFLRPSVPPEPETFLVKLTDGDGVLPRLEAKAPGFEKGLQAANREHRVFSQDSAETGFELKLRRSDGQRDDAFRTELYYRDLNVPMVTGQWVLGNQSPKKFAKQLVVVTSHVTNCFSDLIYQMDTGLQKNADFLAMLFDLCHVSRTGIFRPGSDVTNKMIDAFPNDPGAEALHAILLLSQPTRHFKGRNDITEDTLLKRADELLTDAGAAGQTGELIEIGETVLQARHAGLAEQDTLLSTIDGTSWTAVTAGNWRVTLLRRTGRLAEADYLLSETIRQWPGYEDFYIALSLTQTMQGYYDQALKTISEARELFPGRQQLDMFQEMLTVTYMDEDAAQPLVEKIPMVHIKSCFRAYRAALREERAFDSAACDRMDPTHRSRLFAMVGDYDSAMDLIETFSEDAPGVGVVLHYAEFRELWKTDRMWKVAERFGLVEYWRTTGKKPDMCFSTEIGPICNSKIGK